MKNIFKSLLSITVAVLLVACTVFCVSAETDYGTFENGILNSNMHRLQSTDEFMNGDFEQGLKYWGGLAGKPADSVVELKEENGNHYIHLIGESDWAGIISPRFKVDGVKEGQLLVVLYDWRGDPDFQIYLEQWAMNDPNDESKSGKNARMGGMTYSKVLSEGATDRDWNTSMMGMGPANKGVVAPTEINAAAEDPGYYFWIGIQIATVMGVDVDIDNVRLAYYRQTEQKIYDLDNSTLLFDLKEIDEDEELEEDEEVEEEDEEEEQEEDIQKDISLTGKSEKEKSSFVGSTLFWIIIACAVVVVVAIAVIIILLVKKKKAVPAENETDGGLETSENTPEDDKE